MWKFEEFYITQILYEINFEKCSSTKPAIFAIFRASNFVNVLSISFQKLQKFIKITIHSLEMCQNGRFCTLRISEIDFT